MASFFIHPFDQFRYNLDTNLTRAYIRQSAVSVSESNKSVIRSSTKYGISSMRFILLFAVIIADIMISSRRPTFYTSRRRSLQARCFQSGSSRCTLPSLYPYLSWPRTQFYDELSCIYKTSVEVVPHARAVVLVGMTAGHFRFTRRQCHRPRSALHPKAVVVRIASALDLRMFFDRSIEDERLQEKVEISANTHDGPDPKTALYTAEKMKKRLEPL